MFFFHKGKINKITYTFSKKRLNRQVGVFQLDVQQRTIKHRATGAAISPAEIAFDNQKEAWVLENNYNERCARLKNPVLGVTFTVLSLFKSAGTPLPKPVKLPMISSTDDGKTVRSSSSIANSTEAGRLQALVDRPKMLQLTDGNAAASQETPQQSCQQLDDTASLLRGRVSVGSKQMAGAKRPGEEQTGPEPGSRLGRRLRRKTSEEEILLIPAAASSPKNAAAATATATTAASLSPGPAEALVEEHSAAFGLREEETIAAQNDTVAPGTPSPVPTEVAAEENSVPGDPDHLEDGTENPATDESNGQREAHGSQA